MQKYTIYKGKKNEKYAQGCGQTHLTSQKSRQFRKFSTPFSFQALFQVPTQLIHSFAGFRQFAHLSQATPTSIKRPFAPV